MTAWGARGPDDTAWRRWQYQNRGAAPDLRPLPSATRSSHSYPHSHTPSTFCGRARWEEEIWNTKLPTYLRRDCSNEKSQVWPICYLSPLWGPVVGITYWPSHFLLLSPDKASDAFSTQCSIKPLPIDLGWKMSGGLFTNRNLMSISNQESYIRFLSEGLYWRKDSKIPSEGHQHFSNTERKVSGLKALLKEPEISYWLFVFQPWADLFFHLPLALSLVIWTHTG